MADIAVELELVVVDKIAVQLTLVNHVELVVDILNNCCTYFEEDVLEMAQQQEFPQQVTEPKKTKQLQKLSSMIAEVLVNFLYLYFFVESFVQPVLHQFFLLSVVYLSWVLALSSVSVVYLFSVVELV